MGDWGPRVFDNDSALDHANDIALLLIRHVEEGLPKLVELDNTVTSSVAMFCVLATEFEDFRFMVSKARARRWQVTYQNWFDTHYPQMMNQPNVEAFRIERHRWFARLIELAEGDEDIDQAIDERAS